MHLAQLSDAKCWQVENNNDNSQHVDVTPLVNTPTSGDVYKIFSYNNNKCAHVLGVQHSAPSLAQVLHFVEPAFAVNADPHVTLSFAHVDIMGTHAGPQHLVPRIKV